MYIFVLLRGEPENEASISLKKKRRHTVPGCYTKLPTAQDALPPDMVTSQMVGLMYVTN